MVTLLTVVAEFAAKPGREKDLELMLRDLVEPTRKEEGCVQYDLHVSTTDPGHFLFFENWSSKELLDRHLQSAHLTKFAKESEELLMDPIRIQTYTRIE